MVDYIIEEANGAVEDKIPVKIHSNECDEERRPIFLDTLESRLPILLEVMDDKYIPGVLRKLSSSTSEISECVYI